MGDGSTMRAAVLPGYREPLRIEEVPIPQPGPGQVLLKVSAAGVCHSDLHLIAGEPPVLPSFPWILGHEVAGVVHALGEGVTGIEVGTAVAVFGGQGCGICPTCRAGTEQLCPVGAWTGNGVGRPGGYAEYMVVPAARHLYPIGDLDPAEAAVITDAALTPYRAVRRALPFLSASGTVVVMGLGALGQYAVQHLKMFTPARIVGFDPAPDKRATAASLGADLVLDPTADDRAAQLEQHGIAGTGSAVLDFVGNDATLALAAECIGQQGILVIVGLGGGSLPVGFLTMRPEATITNIYWGAPSELADVLALGRSGRLVNNVTRYSLDDAQTAIDDLEHGRVAGRAVLIP